MIELPNKRLTRIAVKTEKDLKGLFTYWHETTKIRWSSHEVLTNSRMERVLIRELNFGLTIVLELHNNKYLLWGSQLSEPTNCLPAELLYPVGVTKTGCRILS